MRTAVDWLVEELKSRSIDLNKWNDDLVEEAKEMEKQQIIEARQDGYESTYNSCESGCMGRQILETSNEQYYNETFKSE